LTRAGASSRRSSTSALRHNRSATSAQSDLLELDPDLRRSDHLNSELIRVDADRIREILHERLLLSLGRLAPELVHVHRGEQLGDNLELVRLDVQLASLSLDTLDLLQQRVDLGRQPLVLD
jgi:hypothetical protein